MQICCESCNKFYSYEENDGLCPRCGCYNNISHQDAARIEQERKTRRYQRLALLEKRGSLCDAEDAGDPAASRIYAPDCMEKNHDHAHVHTGGANIAAAQRSTVSRSTAAYNTVSRGIPSVTPRGPSARQNTAARSAAPSPAKAGKRRKSSSLFFIVIWLIAVLTALINIFGPIFD